VYLVGSREAALACDPWFVPVDAAIVGIVDDVNNPERAALPEPIDDEPTEANPTPPARKAPARASRDKKS
jgi:hypothetical protein